MPVLLGMHQSTAREREGEREGEGQRECESLGQTSNENVYDVEQTRTPSRFVLAKYSTETSYPRNSQINATNDSNTAKLANAQSMSFSF